MEIIYPKDYWTEPEVSYEDYLEEQERVQSIADDAAYDRWKEEEL